MGSKRITLGVSAWEKLSLILLYCHYAHWLLCDVLLVCTLASRRLLPKLCLDISYTNVGMPPFQSPAGCPVRQSVRCYVRSDGIGGKRYGLSFFKKRGDLTFPDEVSFQRFQDSVYGVSRGGKKAQGRYL